MKKGRRKFLFLVHVSFKIESKVKTFICKR